MAADPTIPLPHRASAASDPSGDALARLADQLHGLSRLAETLTIRLLELEERLQVQQERLDPLIEAAQSADPAQAEALDLRLEETEERLAQLEALLQGGATLRAVPSFGSRVRADRQPFLADGLAADDQAVDDLAVDGFEAHGIAALDPFPEEGEQPFMDERVA
ncbi:MAG: hypothetical protein ACK522_08110 [Synechococcaceae cyanobacterium]|jgi:hypothetical protein